MTKKTKEFISKDNITVEGITEDYVWYHSKKLIDDMQSWQFKLEQLVKVMESRHKEHLKMVNDLLNENRMLRSKEEKK
jgi:hypothetical protein